MREILGPALVSASHQELSNIRQSSHELPTGCKYPSVLGLPSAGDTSATSHKPQAQLRLVRQDPVFLQAPRMCILAAPAQYMYIRCYTDPLQSYQQQYALICQALAMNALLHHNDGAYYASSYKAFS